jgi:hypothetical protein
MRLGFGRVCASSGFRVSRAWVAGYGPNVGIVNRRNAVLGWGVWQVAKRVGKRKAKGAVPKVEEGRPNKSLIAVAGAAVAGAFAFLWSRRGADDG